MSWVEEQDWFGLEDLVQNSIEEQQEIKDNLLYNIRFKKAHAL
jgi:hypothetical protein